MALMTGGEAVVASLKQEGVEILFGVPGVQIMAIFDALYGERDLRLVTVRHEQAAVYMADGYARVTGKPGVALVVPGPGVLNALGALGTAYACSSPVLLLAGQVETRNLGRGKGALHEVNDQLDVVRPLTKWCRRVTEVGEIPGAIHEAMVRMRTGRPRPTEVEIPWDTLGQKDEVLLAPPQVSSPPAPDPQGVREAARLLLAARKPLIWAGGGVILAEASPALIELAELLGAPVATTAEGKGAMPETHPLALGGGYYGFGAVRWAAPRADTLLAVGTRFTWQMVPGTAPQPHQRLIHIDADPGVPGKNFPASPALIADAKAALTALVEEVRRSPSTPRLPWSAAELQDFRDRHRRWLQQKAPLQDELIRAIRTELRDDAILVAGITNIGYWCNLAYETRRPRTFFTSSYFATLGYGFPTALGAKIAAGDRPVVAVVGDGGFLYAASELATAVRYGINLVTIVFTDEAFGSTKSDQILNFKGRVIGTELNNPDFARLAELFGAKGLHAAPERLGETLREALAAQRPAVIEVPLPTLTPPFQISPLGD